MSKSTTTPPVTSSPNGHKPGWYHYRVPVGLDDLTRSAAENSVCLSLLKHMNENYHCYPTYPTIARESHLSKSQVIRVVAELERRQLIRVQRTHRQPNVYTLTFARGLRA